MDNQQRSALQQIAREAAERVTSASHGVDHTQRVVALARQPSTHDDDVNHDVLEAVAWLHDIGREYEREEGVAHAMRSARLADEMLPVLGFSQHDTRLAVAAIADHRFSTGRMPASLEGKILQDADRLDAIGAIGIARVFAV